MTAADARTAAAARRNRPHFLTCACGVKLQRGYKVHYHHSVMTPSFDGWECIICLRAYDANGDPNGRAQGRIRGIAL